MPMQNGKKRTAVVFGERVENGEKPLEIAEDADLFPTWMQNHRAFEVYNRHIRKKHKSQDDTIPELLEHLQIGPPGTGKTGYVFDKHERNDISIAPDNCRRWFDG